MKVRASEVEDLQRRGLIPDSDIIGKGEGYYEVKLSWEQISRLALDMKAILALDAAITVAAVWLLPPTVTVHPMAMSANGTLVFLLSTPAAIPWLRTRLHQDFMSIPWHPWHQCDVATEPASSFKGPGAITVTVETYWASPSLYVPSMAKYLFRTRIPDTVDRRGSDEKLWANPPVPASLDVRIEGIIADHEVHLKVPMKFIHDQGALLDYPEDEEVWALCMTAKERKKRGIKYLSAQGIGLLIAGYSAAISWILG
ncbi:hypothetical protein MRS44_003873 [Fusarium solani]|uniref:uncharacterized protein n=1 Tax=Fusarium solani TaxID=169388 RepID=UPI0032C3EF1B|nr:hypothetical protein MRS44_003873 [Fusarium solani]